MVRMTLVNTVQRCSHPHTFSSVILNPSGINLKTGVIQSEQDETKIDATSENARMIIDGVEYHILMIDDPMGMHQHLEIMLQYVGGGLGV